MGWLGFLWKFGSKRKSFAQHAPRAQWHRQPEALARGYPVLSSPVHWTFVRPVLSGCRRVPSTLSILPTPNCHWAEPPGPGQVFGGRRLRRVSPTNAQPTTHLLFTTVLHHQPVDHRVAMSANSTGFLGATLRHMQEGGRMQTVSPEQALVVVCRKESETETSRRVSRGRYRLPHWA